MVVRGEGAFIQHLHLAFIRRGPVLYIQFNSIPFHSSEVADLHPNHVCRKTYFRVSKMQLQYSLLYLSSAVFTATALVPFPLEERSIGQSCSTPVRTYAVSTLPSYLFPYDNTDSACGMIGRIRNLPKHSRLHNPGFQRSRLLPRPQRRTMLHQENLQYRIQFRYLHEHIG